MCCIPITGCCGPSSALHCGCVLAATRDWSSGTFVTLASVRETCLRHVRVVLFFVLFSYHTSSLSFIVSIKSSVFIM